ncbi:DUF6263 family protein [Confluentibacter sediminis]|uniref:DUF6263 family protein n=1 Tax=Confluentibacter sediminis TaxID=2219045 RepID=UPI000DAC8082|nr:DUF6263 family protein [Confluentibacter sediminis]
MSVFFKGILLFTALFSNSMYAQNTLQYNLKVGDTLSVFQKATQDIIQDIDGNKHELKNILEAEFTFIVSQKTDSTYIISFNFERFKMTTTSNLYGEVINVDTKNSISKDDVQAKVFLGMIGAKLKMDLLKNGKIKSISGTEKMITKMIGNAGISDELTKQVMIESMRKEFGNESLARSFEQMTFIYPNKKVNIGDTWVNNYKGDLIAKNTWKLETITEKAIELSADSNITMQTREEGSSMTLTGKQQTTLTANKATGFIKDMVVKQSAKGVSVMTQMKDLEIPTTITSTTTYKTIKHVQ